MIPFKSEKRNDKFFHEPFFANEKDDLTIKQLQAFWNESYLTLPLTGIYLMFLGGSLAYLKGSIIQMMRAATYYPSSPNLLPYEIITYAGGIMLVQGFCNYLFKE